MDKQALRRAVGAQKRAMSEEEILRRSAQLGQLLRQTQLYQQARTIYGYLSFNQEVRTVPILEQALRDGKQVAVPRVYGQEMKFHLLEDLSLAAPGYFGIPEPPETAPIAQDETALVLMPGLAFDRQGHRVGYGGGFYDRFLAAEPRHPTLALCYDFQVFPTLETQAHDIPADLVLWA